MNILCMTFKHELNDQRRNEWSKQHHVHLNVDKNYKINLNFIVFLGERAESDIGLKVIHVFFSLIIYRLLYEGNVGIDITM